MDIKLVAEHVRGGHLFIEDLPVNKRAEVESMVKSLKPLNTKKKKSK